MAVALIAASASVVAAQAPAAAAAGGTIVFERDHNLWLVRGDGSGLHQVTRDGTASLAYRSPSMSDDGTIAAALGPEVVRMRQNGEVLNRFDPPPLTNSVSHPVDGPVNYVAISPDGAHIAYGFSGYTCPIGASCMVRSAIAVTPAASFSGPTTTSYQHHPSWVSNSRLMTHGGYGSHVTLHDLGASEPALWFNDDDVYESGTDLGDASLSRDGTKLVAIRGYGDSTQMVWYSVAGDPRAAAADSLPNPTPLCGGSPGDAAADEKLHDPTWSPDGAAFAIGAKEGIWVVTPAAVCEATTTLLLGAGSSPFWSPAALNPPPLSGTTPPPGPGAGGGGDDGNATTFTMGSRPTLKGKAKVGKRLTVNPGRWTPTPTKIRYTWLRNGKKIKGATSRSYKLRRTDRGRRISVKVVVTRAGTPSASARTKQVRVR